MKKFIAIIWCIISILSVGALIYCAFLVAGIIDGSEPTISWQSFKTLFLTSFNGLILVLLTKDKDWVKQGLEKLFKGEN